MSCWSVFDSLTGAFLWYTQTEELATPPLRGEPTPDAWVVVEDATDSVTGLVFIGPPSQYAANFYLFRDPTTFAITVQCITATVKAEKKPQSMTASFVEEVLILRGTDPAKAKSKAAKMVSRLAAEDDWEHLED